MALSVPTDAFVTPSRPSLFLSIVAYCAALSFSRLLFSFQTLLVLSNTHCVARRIQAFAKGPLESV